MNPTESLVDSVVFCVLCGLSIVRCCCRHDWRDGDALLVTHTGVLELAGHRLRCHVLNSGQRVFDAEDVEAFFS